MRDEYDFKESKQNPYAKKFDDIVESSWLNSLAKLIKKFKSSKSYWSVSYIVILFTLREAGALVYGTILKEYVQKHLESSDYTWLWSAIEFVFGFGGSVELIILGLFFFIVLSLVKISEKNTITLKENFLSLLLSFTIVGMSIYMIRSNDSNHSKTHENQEIMIKNDENMYKLLVKVAQNKETEFLEKYFGKDYAVILKNPKTYHNFTTLLKQTNKSADELLKEREELLQKIASQSFNPKLQKQIDKAFRELRYEDARELIDGFLEANSGKEKEIIKAHYLTALSYMEQMRYPEAKDEFEKIALNIDDVDILNDCAEMYYILGEYDKAIEYQKKVLNIRVSSVGNNHAYTAVSYDNIGSSFYSKGQYDKAINNHKKALEIRLATVGENHPDTAVSYNNIGSSLYNKGLYDEAISEHEKALNIQLKTIGENHSSTAISYNSIGSVYYSMHLYDKAIKNHKKALEIRLSTVGKNHPDTAVSYNNIGSALYCKGKYNKAIKEHKKALEIQLKTIGENHSSTAVSYNSIGSVLYSKGKYDEAMKYHKKALQIRLATVGENHPDTATSYYNIGLVFDIKYKGKYEAIDNYKKSVEILKKVFPNGHPNLKIFLNKLNTCKNSVD